MKNNFNHFISNAKLPLLILISYILFTYILKAIAPNGANWGAEKNLIGYSAICFTLSCFLKRFSIHYMISYAGFIFLYLSTTLCQALTGMTVNGIEMVISCALGTFLFAILTGIILLSSTLPKTFHYVLKFLSTILFILFLMYPISFWAYYFLTYQFLTVDIVMTLFQTNLAEAMSYLSMYNPIYLVSFTIFILLFLTLFIRHSQLTYSHLLPPRKNILLVAILLIFSILKIPASLDCQAGGVLMATKHELQAYKNYGVNQKIRETQLAQSNISLTQSSPGIYLLIIGESETRDHMSLYGYNKKTTPWLETLQDDPNTIIFKNAYTNFVATIPSLTYALSEKNQYNDVDLSNAYSLIEIAKAAGYKTYWISNQFKWGPYDNPITHIATTADKQIWLNSRAGDVDNSSYYDGKIAEVIPDLSTESHALIIVHLMGCHWTYADRYPKEYDQFVSNDSRVDTYNNAVLYNDYVIQHITQTMKKYNHFKGWIYFSDHGEDVEQHLGHNPTQFTWPMDRIPLIMQFSPTFIQENPQIFQGLASHTNSYWSNDLLYNVMLSILGITNAPNTASNLDISSALYDRNKDNLLTLHEKKAIMEEP